MWTRLLLLFVFVGAALGPHKATAQENEIKPTGVASLEPYRHWTRHTGTAHEASVLIHVMDESGRVLRMGNGFIVRCDGFVLVPESLFPRNSSTSNKILVSVAQAEGETLTEPLFAVGPPRYYGKKTDYVLLKVNNHHLPCLPLLDSANIRKGAKVKVVWAAPQEIPSVKVKTLSVEATIEPASDDEMHLSLDIAESTPLPPAGATVVDPESGASLGIITKTLALDSKTGGIRFSPYTYLNYVTNEIGLRIDAHEEEDAPGDMVRVPGGPVALLGNIFDQYRASYKTTVACTPPFWIDKNPVTIGQYRDWLGKVVAPYQPEGWLKDNEVRTQNRRSDLPVTGMLTQDAMRYAVAQRKRLVTPVEWLKASEFDDDSWYKEYRKKVSNMQIWLVDLDLKKFDVFANYIRNMQLEQIKKKGQSTSAYASPLSYAGTVWIDTDEIRRINQQQSDEYRKWFEKYWFALQSPPVNFYEEDKSKYGVRNIWMGPPEIVLPNIAHLTMETAWKPGQALIDPYLSSFIRTYDRSGDVFVNVAHDDLDGVFITFFHLPTMRPTAITILGKGTTIGFNLISQPQVRAGFRCAR